MKLLSRLFLLAIILLCSTSFTYAAANDTDNTPRLMQVTPMLAFDASSESGGGGLTLMQVNPQVLHDLSKNRLDRVAIPALGRDKVFNKSAGKIRSKTSTWIGKEDEGSSSVVLTIGGDHFFGRMVTAEGIITFEPGQTSSQVVSTVLDPEFEMPMGQDQILAPQPNQELFTAMDEPSDDGSRIDVMVLYTDGMAAAWGEAIDTRIQYLIDLSNTAFSNSNIDTAFNLVYSQEVVYTDDSIGGMSEALDDLSYNNGVFADIENLRTIYGADQVTLLRRYVDEACGIAYVLHSDNARWAYAVVHDGNKVSDPRYYCSDLTYAHEVGHNLGCAHDRDNAAVDGRFDYSYGYQQVPGYEFRTVMAYNCPGGCQRISYFSNPDVQYDGYDTGIAPPGTTPDEISADNASTISQTRVGMAAFRSAVGITVTSPNNSEQWARSTGKTITWTSANITGDVTIELYRNDNFDSTITPSTPNTGSFIWNIPSDQALDSTYRIRISSEDYPDIYDECNSDFSRTEAPAPPLALPWINLLLLT